MLTTLENINEVSFGTFKKMPNFYSVNVYRMDDDKKTSPFYVQTPKMKLTKDVTKAESTHVEVDCVNEEFLNAMQNVEMTLLDKVKEHKNEWFPSQNLSDSFLEVGLMSVVTRSNHLKLKRYSDLVIYDGGKASIESCKTGDEVKLILQLCGIWFTKNRWGVSWMVVQMKSVTKTTKMIKEYLFPEEDNVEDELVEPPPEVNDEL